MNVLLSNDDGVQSPGFRALCREFQAKGHNICAVAPMRQQSGVSHAITVFEPLRSQVIDEPGFKAFGIFGTPADCVKLGLAELAPWQPDLVAAGINLGRNVGPDIFYSGTIGAAAEGAHAGIAAMAFSFADPQPSAEQLAEAARIGVDMAERIDWHRIRGGLVINVNYPAALLGSCKGSAVCAQAPPVWKNAYGRREDPRGWPYWWMEGGNDWAAVPDDSDMALLESGYITITPLQFEHTAMKAMDALALMTNAIRC